MAVWSHSTGSATVTYGMTLNGVACWPSNNTAATVGRPVADSELHRNGFDNWKCDDAARLFFVYGDQLNRIALDIGPTFGGYFQRGKHRPSYPAVFLGGVDTVRR